MLLERGVLLDRVVRVDHLQVLNLLEAALLIFLVRFTDDLVTNALLHVERVQTVANLVHTLFQRDEALRPIRLPDLTLVDRLPGRFRRMGEVIPIEYRIMNSELQPRCQQIFQRSDLRRWTLQQGYDVRRVASVQEHQHQKRNQRDRTRGEAPRQDRGTLLAGSSIDHQQSVPKAWPQNRCVRGIINGQRDAPLGQTRNDQQSG